jgi:hypothetical protein
LSFNPVVAADMWYWVKNFLNLLTFQIFFYKMGRQWHSPQRVTGEFEDKQCPTQHQDMAAMFLSLRLNPFILLWTRRTPYVSLIITPMSQNFIEMAERAEHTWVKPLMELV